MNKSYSINIFKDIIKTLYCFGNFLDVIMTYMCRFMFYLLVPGKAITEIKTYFQGILFELSSVTLNIVESSGNIFID